MDNNDLPSNTEAELESFRQRWREEVSARAKSRASGSPATGNNLAPLSRLHVSRSTAPDGAPPNHTRQLSAEEADEAVPYVYHSLGEKHHGRRLDETSTQTAAALTATREPTSALEHYEKAVEKESQGSLGDSVNLYRKAFRLDSKVHETYKAKHFPPSYFSGHKQGKRPSLEKGPLRGPCTEKVRPQGSNSFNTANHSLYGLSSSIQDHFADFSASSIQGVLPPTDLSPAPPCPISAVPEEILVEVLRHLAIKDVASFARSAQVCRRFAYFVFTEDQIWKRLALGPEYGFAAMHYTWSCRVDGKPFGHRTVGGIISDIAHLDLSDAKPTQVPLSSETHTQLLVPAIYPTYRTLFQRRPRIRFNGCYISTVNYTRPGQSSPTSVTWNSPIHIVTYYRYLRFLRDGTCISLLTTSEPTEVVPYLYIEHMHKNHGALPTAPVKDALLGRWRLTGPYVRSEEDGAEEEGTVIVETAGATPKYMYKMALSLGSTGRGTKNNKLAWQGYWSYNRLTDDWGEFGLKNDRAFYWSRVRSYGMSWDESGVQVV